MTVGITGTFPATEQYSGNFRAAVECSVPIQYGYSRDATGAALTTLPVGRAMLLPQRKTWFRTVGGSAADLTIYEIT